MTRNELSRNYWRYYMMLEDKFLSTANYVEINLVKMLYLAEGQSEEKLVKALQEKPGLVLAGRV